MYVYKLSQMSTDAVSQLSPNCAPTISQLLILTSFAVRGSEISVIGDKVVRVVKVVKSVFNVVNLRFFCEKWHLISESAVLTLRLMC